MERRIGKVIAVGDGSATIETEGAPRCVVEAPRDKIQIEVGMSVTVFVIDGKPTIFSWDNPEPARTS